MKAKAIIAFSFLVSFAAGAPSAHADAKWQLRRVTTSSVCHVQQADTRPLLGTLMSEHTTRKEACTAAKAAYDSSMSNPSKCWTYGGGTKKDCKSDAALP